MVPVFILDFYFLISKFDPKTKLLTITIFFLKKKAKHPFVPLTFTVIFSYASNVSFVSVVPPMWNVSFNYAPNFKHPQTKHHFRTIWARFWSDFIWVLIFSLKCEENRTRWTLERTKTKCSKTKHFSQNFHVQNDP